MQFFLWLRDYRIQSLKNKNIFLLFTFYVKLYHIEQQRIETVNIFYRIRIYII